MRRRKVVKGKGFEKYITGQVGKYQFQAGLLQNKPHYAPLKTLLGYQNGKPVFQKHWYSYAGKKLLRQGNKPDGTLWKIGQKMDDAFMWLRKPFTWAKNADLLAVINFIVDNLNGKGNQQRILNATQFCGETMAATLKRRQKKKDLISCLWRQDSFLKI